MIDTNCDMRFMANNFLDTGYNTYTVSSILAGYYQSDLTTPERARTFKFGGRFLIVEDENDLISINANAYQIPAGEYTAAGLAAAITALYVADNITCTPPTLANGYEFSFERATAFTLNTSAITDSVWQTLGYNTGVDMVAILDGATYYAVADQSRIHWPNEEIVIDFGYQAAIGFIGLIGDLSSELKVPEGAEVRFQANNIDDFTAPPVDKVLTWSKRGLFTFIDDVADSAWRYCKLIITHPEGPDHSEIGYLYIGDYAFFIDRNISVGIGIDYVDPTIISSADDGHEYANEKTPYRMFTGLAVGLSSFANANYLKRLYHLKKKGSPFFVALDPKVQITDSVDDMTMFCRFSKVPDTRHIIHNKYELNFELKEAL